MNVWKITPNLFIRGKFDDRPDRRWELNDLGVTMVLCMLRKRDEELVQTSTWLCYYDNFPIADSKGPAPERSIENAWAAAKLAAFEIKRGGRVLIHCIGARDRAPFTAALTLHLLEGISGAEAMFKVRSKKRTTFYNDGYRSYLNELQATNAD